MSIWLLLDCSPSFWVFFFSLHQKYFLRHYVQLDSYAVWSVAINIWRLVAYEERQPFRKSLKRHSLQSTLPHSKLRASYRNEQCNISFVYHSKQWHEVEVLADIWAERQVLNEETISFTSINGFYGINQCSLFSNFTEIFFARVYMFASDTALESSKSF